MVDCFVVDCFMVDCLMVEERAGCLGKGRLMLGKARSQNV